MLYASSSILNSCILGAAQSLNELAKMVRGELPKLSRAVLCALITIDVHARDVVSDLVRNEVSEPDSFDWLKQLRY